MSDKLFTCQNCHNPFVYSEYEQKSNQKNNKPDPLYCPICSSIKASQEKHPPKPQK